MYIIISVGQTIEQIYGKEEKQMPTLLLDDVDELLDDNEENNELRDHNE